MFPSTSSRETLGLSRENETNCFPRDHTLSVYECMSETRFYKRLLPTRKQNQKEESDSDAGECLRNNTSPNHWWWSSVVRALDRARQTK